jgi:hypothetical protein
MSLSGRIKAQASPNVSVLLSGKASCRGGKQIRIDIKTAKQWCEYHGIPVKNNIAILYKGLDDNFLAQRSFPYLPSSTPIAPDWDNGKAECGGGLHFSPTPSMTLRYNDTATRFMACPVNLKDMRSPQETDEYPDKIKARGCRKPIYEVDIDGKRIAQKKRL